MVLVEAILFVLSSGLAFHERFRKNRPVFFLAVLVALISSYFLMEEMTARLIRREMATERSVAPVVTKPPPVTEQPPVTTSTRPATGPRCVIFNGREVCP